MSHLIGMRNICFLNSFWDLSSETRLGHCCEFTAIYNYIDVNDMKEDSSQASRFKIVDLLKSGPQTNKQKMNYLIND